MLERRIGKNLGFFLHSDATLSDSQIGPREQPNFWQARHFELTTLHRIRRKNGYAKFSNLIRVRGTRSGRFFLSLSSIFVSSRFRTMLSSICRKTRIVTRVQNFRMQIFTLSHPALAPSGQPGQTRPGHCEPKITFFSGIINRDPYTS